MSSRTTQRELVGMVPIPRSTFVMASDHHCPDEAPAHEVTVDAFWIDAHTVTNENFARFVKATGYVTLAEKPADPAMYPGAKPDLLAPASVVFHRPAGPVDMRNPYNWWSYVAGADWRHPGGPGTTIDGLDDHPVVHVAYEDAQAYARWIGKQLPTEAQWELAARGGLDGAECCLGNDYAPNGTPMANTWQGQFPSLSSLEVGYEWTAPIGSLSANGYGLHDMAGNVWEWTADLYQDHARVKIARRMMNGGSYSSATSYCHRYRLAARMAQPIDTSTCHLGFRCVVR